MKSQEKDLLQVATHLYYDVVAMCTAVPTARDIEVLLSRTKHEGLSFLMITLPSFGSDFERSLANGLIDPTYFRSFKKCGLIPAFLQGITGRVFDVETGFILANPCVKSIRAIAQFCYTFKKIEHPCSEQRVRAAFDGYARDERTLREVARTLTKVDVKSFVAVSDILWGDVLVGVEPYNAIPKHGPGATAEGISGNAKYSEAPWYRRLEPYFPMLTNRFSSETACGVMTDEIEANSYLYPRSLRRDPGSHELTIKAFQAVREISRDKEKPVKVIQVPKTLKSPRIIAIEPVCMQYTQQGLSNLLTKRLEEHPLTAGHINFTDQAINGWIALNSSRHGKFATLDLSAASDRVPLALASMLFRTNPDLKRAVLACRSRTARINDKIFNLHKFASMGSALCFPVEAMYFYTLCVMSLLECRDLPVGYHEIKSVTRDIYIYGDDIIVPSDEAERVIGMLTKYYCKLNVSKSFWTGKFRESCGQNAYDGQDVTPVYLRMHAPIDRRNKKELVSRVDASNQFYTAGYIRVASYIKKQCRSVFGKRNLPVTVDEFPGLGFRLAEQDDHTLIAYGRKRQRCFIRSFVTAPLFRDDPLQGYPALTKCLLQMESRHPDDETVNGEHLQRTARYRTVTLKSGWTSPY